MAIIKINGNRVRVRKGDLARFWEDYEAQA